MMVTGVQPAGAKGLGTVQGAGVDTKELARPASPLDDSDARAPASGRAASSQPVVFPRQGLPLDQRPVANRLQDATQRYSDDGGNEQHPDDRNGDT